MKMEERDRLIRDEGEKIGRVEGKAEGRAEGRAEGKASLVSIIRKKALKGLDTAAISELLETGQKEIREILDLAESHPEWSDLEIAAELIRRQ